MAIYLGKKIMLTQIALILASMLAIFIVNTVITIIGLVLFAIVIMYLSSYLEKTPSIREVKAVLTLSFISIVIGISIGLVIGYCYGLFNTVLTGISIMLLILIYTLFIERVLK